MGVEPTFSVWGGVEKLVLILSPKAKIFSQIVLRVKQQRNFVWSLSCLDSALVFRVLIKDNLTGLNEWNVLTQQDSVE